jgi:hypothetical protein
MSSTPLATLSDLVQPLLLDSPEHVTRFDRQTGRIVTVERWILSALEEGQDERVTNLPQWQREEVEIARAICVDSGERFIAGPSNFEFHEYRQMEQFIGSLSDPDAADQLWRAIKGKGAFRYFKDTLHRLGLQDQWYRYRDEAMKAFVIAWAQENHVPYKDDTANRPL